MDLTLGLQPLEHRLADQVRMRGSLFQIRCQRDARQGRGNILCTTVPTANQEAGKFLVPLRNLLMGMTP